MLPLTQRGEDWETKILDREYKIRGLGKNLAYDTLKIVLRVACGDQCHLDTIDMCQARQRAGFVHQAAQELGIPEETIKNDIGKLLLALESLQDKLIQKTLAPVKPSVPVMSEAERREAVAFLMQRDLIAQVVRDFHACGLVGEDTNCLVGYLATLTRMFDDPLPLMIQALSGAGKSALLDALLRFAPPEAVVKYTAISGQALFYMGETDLAHKILAISEQAGADRATYALKIMQSEKCLKIGSVGKDPKTGKMVTHEYKTEGPVQSLFSTTNAEIDEELLNRGLLLTSNITREQTQEIHKLQREKETLAGLLKHKEREWIIRRHQNAQRLLRPLLVINPYAEQLTFLDNKLRTRRDQPKYLTLIRAIAFLHQYQRPVKKVQQGGQVYEYIEVTRDDIALANQLAGEVMGISLDELAPQTRKMLGLIVQLANKKSIQEQQELEAIYLTQREIRDFTGWGQTQVKIHLQRLVEMEYLLVSKSKVGQRYLYQLLYKGEGESGQKFLLGLLDIEKLRRKTGDKYDTDRSVGTGERSGSGRPKVGPKSAQSRSEKLASGPEESGTTADEAEKGQKLI